MTPDASFLPNDDQRRNLIRHGLEIDKYANVRRDKDGTAVEPYDIAELGKARFTCYPILPPCGVCCPCNSRLTLPAGRANVINETVLVTHFHKVVTGLQTQIYHFALQLQHERGCGRLLD